MKIEALIADNKMRRRDERFATRDRHRTATDPLHNGRLDDTGVELKETIVLVGQLTFRENARDYAVGILYDSCCGRLELSRQRIHCRSFANNADQA
jgi:hypothetical protein